MSSQQEPEPRNPGGRGRMVKLVVAIALAAVVVAGVVLFGDQQAVQYLADREADFSQCRQQHPMAVYAIAFVVYVTVTGLSLPGAAVLTIAYGRLFGWWPAVVLVSFASTTGATIAFLLSRYLLRETVQSYFGDRTRRFNAALEQEGAFYLFTLRLIAGVPFFVINVVMGLTPLRARTFWWVSQLGMLPGTMLFTYIGFAVPSLQKLADQGVGAVFEPWQMTQILFAFAALGLFPLITKWIVQRLPKKTLPANID